MNKYNDIDIIDKLSKDISYNPFKEVEIVGNEEEQIPCEEPQGEIYDTIQQMRQLVTPMMMQPSLNFKRQGEFLKDVEDDYSPVVRFDSFLPHYNVMSNEQLRTYLTWRSKVRKGQIEFIGYAYACLLSFELINNIGVSSPEAGLDRLIQLYFVCRQANDALQRNMKIWIKHYHLIYDSLDFLATVKKYQLEDVYPELQEEKESKSYMRFATTEPLAFFSSPQIKILWAVYNMVFSELIKKKSQKWLDSFFYNSFYERIKLFPLAILCATPNRNQRIVLAPNEEYEINGIECKIRREINNSEGKMIATLIYKLVVNEITKAYDLDYTMRISLTGIPQEFRKGISPSPEQPFNFVLKRMVEAAFKKVSAPKFVFNPHLLDQIKLDAQTTQEKLIVEEEIEVTNAPQVEVKKEEISIEDPYLALVTLLSSEEKEVLKLMLEGKNIETYARSKSLMLEVLIDAINQKALEVINDNLIEDTQIYEDYQERIRGVIYGTKENC